MTIHRDIEERLMRYVSRGMLNTIFYGPNGSGKHTLALKMLNSLNKDVQEKEKTRQWEDSGITFYSTSTYIRFDAKECTRNKANLPQIIEEIGCTRDISGDSNKVIYIRNINYLGDQQESFRQLVEDTYLTCRYVFTCHSIDTVDPALNSRCFLIRVPSPSEDVLKKWIFEENPSYDGKICDRLIQNSKRNMSTLKTLMHLQKKIPETVNPLENIGKSIQERFRDCNNLSTIHSLAEKYHYSEFAILDICRCMDNVGDVVIHLQKYASLPIPSLYDTIMLFMSIAKSVNNNLN